MRIFFKKYIHILLCVVLTISFTACSNKNVEDSYYDEIVTTYVNGNSVVSDNIINGTQSEKVTTEIKGNTAVSSSASDNGNIDSSSDDSETVSSKNKVTSSKKDTSELVSKPKKNYKEEEWRLHPEDFKLLCLTFDDGSVYPSYNDNDAAIKIAKVIKKYHGSATYFYTGSAARADVDVAKWLVDNGFEIGNHSNTHINFGSANYDMGVCESEVSKVNEIFYQKLGINLKCFRGGGFSISDNLRAVLSRYEIPYIAYQFTLGADWSGGDATKESVKNALLNKASDGAIVAGHSTNRTNCTPDALEEALPILYEQGYRFCSVSELFQLRGVKSIPYGKQIRAVTDNGVVVTF